MTDRSEDLTVDIARLGPRGDGIADVPGGRLYVAGALPGETVRVRTGGRRGQGQVATLKEIVTPSPDRVDPPCRHFATCGGCSVQHLADGAYAAWKHGLVATALERVGFDPGLVAPLVRTAANGRRRAEFAAFRPRAAGSKTFFGFHARASRHVVELEACPILHPPLMALVPKLRAVLSDLVPPGARWDVSVTLADNGADVMIAANHAPGPDAGMALAMFAEAEDLARVSWTFSGDVEPVAMRRAPVLELSGHPVEIPPGVFLQASGEAERELARLVRDGMAGTAFADLYCGVGTFTLPLAAAGAKVVAIDGDGAAIEALSRAAGLAGFGGQVRAETRDLARRPLATAELKGFDTVVFDPPRAGAAAQADEIAKSDVGRVVAVSCNPSTFARDAATLAASGYRLERVNPVDQFVWTGHVELVGVLARD